MPFYFLGVCLTTQLQARKLPTNYNEATYIYFTVFTMDIIIVSYIAIRFIFTVLLFTMDNYHSFILIYCNQV